MESGSEASETISQSPIEKENQKVLKNFRSNFLVSLIYFSIVVYLYQVMIKRTHDANDITRTELKAVLFLYMLFIFYLFYRLYSNIQSRPQTIFVCVIALIYGLYYYYTLILTKQTDPIFGADSIKGSADFQWVQLLIPFFWGAIAIFALTSVPAIYERIISPMIPQLRSWNEVTGPHFGYMRGWIIVTILLFFLFQQYNYNTPSSNVLQPIVMGPVVLYIVFRFISYMARSIGIIKKYNGTNTMVSLYLIFSVLWAFYLYSFIESIKKLSEAGPEEAKARKEREAEWESDPNVITKYIKKYIGWILVACIIAIYWIRDIVTWRRRDALVYLVVTLLMIYTAGIATAQMDGLNPLLSTLLFLEWFLLTKLRFHHVLNLLNILLRGVEAS